MSLPKPDCEIGYTDEQVRQITGNRYQDFCGWMYGQTMALCEGSVYNHVQKRYQPSGCGPHGGITYVWDLQRFLDGHPIID